MHCLDSSGNIHIITFTDILYIPNFRYTLISGDQIFWVKHSLYFCQITQMLCKLSDRQEVAYCPSDNTLVNDIRKLPWQKLMHIDQMALVAAATILTTVKVSLYLLHYRLGHLNYDDCIKIANDSDHIKLINKE